jgi:ubiquinone/menaquinone biosynthesis C-methylase UbiE
VRVLDLGCGDGLTPQKLDLPLTWQMIGLDIKLGALRQAQTRQRHAAFVCSAAERLPFPDSYFDFVVSNVALPYTDIARTLTEAHRVLSPGGTFLASLHPMSHTLAEFRTALPRPVAVLYRFWVLANGFIFHATGRNFGEAFQTERGTRIAFERANFAAISFRHDSKRWFVEATKPRTALSSTVTVANPAA